MMAEVALENATALYKHSFPAPGNDPLKGNSGGPEAYQQGQYNLTKDINSMFYPIGNHSVRDLVEALYQNNKEKGLVVLGFPSNDFWQEAGNENKTAEVCRRDYGVTFPMFNRVSVRGADAVPLFKGLAAAADGDAPNWNFHKYLVGRDGKLIASYGANQNPSDDPLKQQIIEALGR